MTHDYKYCRMRLVLSNSCGTTAVALAARDHPNRLKSAHASCDGSTHSHVSDTVVAKALLLLATGHNTGCCGDSQACDTSHTHTASVSQNNERHQEASHCETEYQAQAFSSVTA